VQEDTFLLIGRIVGVHGLKGILKVHSYAESPDVFCAGSLIFLKKEDDRSLSYSITMAKPHKRTVLLSLDGVSTVDMAKELVGAGLFLERTQLPELEEGTYYWHDIVGLSVFAIDEEYLGQVDSIIPTGSNDVLVVKNSDREILIPALESVVLEIDFKSKMMRIDLPEGL
jgi:16S rRNA processing protein RimM